MNKRTIQLLLARSLSGIPIGVAYLSWHSSPTRPLTFGIIYAIMVSWAFSSLVASSIRNSADRGLRRDAGLAQAQTLHRAAREKALCTYYASVRSQTEDFHTEAKFCNNQLAPKLNAWYDNAITPAKAQLDASLKTIDDEENKQFTAFRRSIAPGWFTTLCGIAVVAAVTPPVLNLLVPYLLH